MGRRFLIFNTSMPTMSILFVEKASLRFWLISIGRTFKEVCVTMAAPP